MDYHICMSKYAYRFYRLDITLRQCPPASSSQLHVPRSLRSNQRFRSCNSEGLALIIWLRFSHLTSCRTCQQEAPMKQTPNMIHKTAGFGLEFCTLGKPRGRRRNQEGLGLHWWFLTDCLLRQQDELLCSFQRTSALNQFAVFLLLLLSDFKTYGFPE